MLRDEFGGFCRPDFPWEYDQRYVDQVGDDTWSISNPWNDGGCVPGAPNLEVTADDTSLTVNWSGPDSVGSSPIMKYQVQSRPAGQDYSNEISEFLSDVHEFVIPLESGTSIASVRIRAVNEEGDGEWKEIVNTAASNDATLSTLTVNDGTTDHTINLATTPYTVNVANSVEEVTLTAETTNTGASVSMVTLDGSAIADADFTDGIITVPSLVVGDNPIVVTVTAADTTTTGLYTVTVSRALARPRVTPTPGSTTSLDVGWTAPPDTTGISYDVQYREGTSGGFSDGPQAVAGTSTSTSITSLMMNTSYQVRVRMTSDKGDSEWSSNRRAWTHPPEAPVPSDWEDLVPGGLAAGAKFRLLYVSHVPKWNRSEIDRYSEWVQAFAAGNESGKGHADIRAYASAFRAVGCGSRGRCPREHGNPVEFVRSRRADLLAGRRDRGGRLRRLLRRVLAERGRAEDRGGCAEKFQRQCVNRL